MADVKTSELAALDLPYRRLARVRLAEFDSGMRMVRLVLKEGHRITQVDLDSETARALAAALTQGAEAAEAQD